MQSPAELLPCRSWSLPSIPRINHYRVDYRFWNHDRPLASRYCHALAYRSQRETDDDRATRRADTIRRRLGWGPGILNGLGVKPAGMHWRTYERQLTQHDDFVGVSLADIARKVGLLRSQLEDIEDAAASWR
jgi:hypothetical protein